MPGLETADTRERIHLALCTACIEYLGIKARIKLAATTLPDQEEKTPWQAWSTATDESP